VELKKSHYLERPIGVKKVCDS